MLKVDLDDEQELQKFLHLEDLDDMAELSYSGCFIVVKGLHRSEELDLIDRLASKNVGFSIIEE